MHQLFSAPEALRLWLLLLKVDLKLIGQSWSQQREWILAKAPAGIVRRDPSAYEQKALERWSRLLLTVRRWRIRRQVPCLALALTLRERAQKSGLYAELTLGARRDGSGRIDAHAWLVMGTFRLDPLATAELFTAFHKGTENR
ncbi:MAG: lasso peptide biosynthesis B2 protein [Spirochaetales bacterium]|nr:lasso peptide biosynthesis B2 protein [Spirochaetales bacterium]